MIATTETIQDNNAYWRLFSFQIVPRVFLRTVGGLFDKHKETRRTREQEECLWLRDDV
jgi:hypothetical protein